MSTEIETKPVPPTAVPSGLDGVKIEGCQFTESVGKKEPRPPLVCGYGVFTGRLTGNVWLDMGAYRICVHVAHTPIDRFGEKMHIHPNFRLDWDPVERAIPYTGPIRESWWPIIRKWWSP